MLEQIARVMFWLCVGEIGAGSGLLPLPAPVTLARTGSRFHQNHRARDCKSNQNAGTHDLEHVGPLSPVMPSPVF
jgi:hypothetical protein